MTSPLFTTGFKKHPEGWFPKRTLTGWTWGCRINRRDAKLASQWLKDSAQRPGTKGGFWSQQEKKRRSTPHVYLHRCIYIIYDICIHIHMYNQYMHFISTTMMYNEVCTQICESKIYKKVYSARIATVKKQPWLSAAI